MVAKLKKHNILVQEKGAEEPLQAIDTANTAFNEMANSVINVKNNIIPLQTKETIVIKANLDKFM